MAMYVVVAVQLLNSCHAGVRVYTYTCALLLKPEGIKDLQADGGTRSHSQEQPKSQPPIPFSTERKPEKLWVC